MDQAVARERTAPVETPRTREIRELSSGFFDDHLERRDVPNRHDRVEADLACTLGYEHVRPEIAKATVPLYFLGQFKEALGFWEISRCSADEIPAPDKSATLET